MPESPITIIHQFYVCIFSFTRQSSLHVFWVPRYTCEYLKPVFFISRDSSLFSFTKFPYEHTHLICFSYALESIRRKLNERVTQHLCINAALSLVCENTRRGCTNIIRYRTHNYSYKEYYNFRVSVFFFLYDSTETIIHQTGYEIVPIRLH